MEACIRERFIFLLSLLCCVVLCYVHQEVGLWGKARGIIANIKNLINLSILFVGRAFAENSHSTSLQHVAGRRVGLTDSRSGVECTRAHTWVLENHRMT